MKQTAAKVREYEECKQQRAALTSVSCTRICGTVRAVTWFSRFVSRSLTTEASLCGICGEPSGTGAVRFSLVSIIPLILYTSDVIQGDPGGRVNVLGGDIIGHCQGGKTCKRV